MVLADVHCICSNKANMNHYDTTTVFYSQSLSVSSLIHSFSHYITPWTKRAEPARTSLWEKFQCRSKFFNASFFKTNSEENFINAINRDLLHHHSFIQSCDKQPASIAASSANAVMWKIYKNDVRKMNLTGRTFFKESKKMPWTKTTAFLWAKWREREREIMRKNLKA